MAIEVLKPGLATSVQDAGRPGYYNLGIPLSGALDQYALRVANLLAGNDEGAALLEAALLGPELLFRTPAIVAVAGAEATPKINGERRPRNQSFAVKADDRLSFDYMKLGTRIYIAVAGGIDVPPVLGSRSTYGLGALGGFAGRKLAAGDVLPVGAAPRGARAGRAASGDLVGTYPKSLEIRVLPGLYFHRLTDDSAASFFADTWTVAPEADRIGYRYRKGRALSFRERKQPFGAGSDPSNIVDAGYPYGSIQVPGGVEPIILHRDAVSGGGYAMIGTVISADMDRIAQMQPNNTCRFVRVDMDAALKGARRVQGAARAAAGGARRLGSEWSCPYRIRTPVTAVKHLGVPKALRMLENGGVDRIPLSESWGALRSEKALWEARVFEYAIRRMSALDAVGDSEVAVADRAMPDLMATLARSHETTTSLLEGAALAPDRSRPLARDSGNAIGGEVNFHLVTARSKTVHLSDLRRDLHDTEHELIEARSFSRERELIVGGQPHARLSIELGMDCKLLHGGHMGLQDGGSISTRADERRVNLRRS